MATWTRVEVPLSEGFRFPNLCPSCLRPEPEARLRVPSDKGRLKAFYMVAAKWERLWVTVPFCKECADRRKRWERRDLAALLIATASSLAVAAWLAAKSGLAPWAFWAVFLGAAIVFTVSFNRLLSDNRAVRIEAHNENTVTFALSSIEYAREFSRLNG